eukprot:scpid88479/ scgid15497/ Putative nuclease HARBI1; Harbinger transposase-derived nuclease
MFDCLFGRCAEKMQYYGAKPGVSGARRLSHRSLDPEFELFVVLAILKRGFQQRDLGYRLGISQPTVSRIWSTWLRVLHDRLVQVPIWLPRSSIEEDLPECFRETFPSTRVVLDCTEFFIEMPSSFRAQSETFSSYKHHRGNTAKALVAIAPHGAVLFASKLYVGRQTDKAIVQHSGLVSKLESGDVVMADRGFLIGDLLPDGVSLVTPSFMEDRPQLPLPEEAASRKLSSCRIHVERIIRRIKVCCVSS